MTPERLKEIKATWGGDIYGPIPELLMALEGAYAWQKLLDEQRHRIIDQRDRARALASEYKKERDEAQGEAAGLRYLVAQYREPAPLSEKNAKELGLETEQNRLLKKLRRRSDTIARLVADRNDYRKQADEKAQRAVELSCQWRDMRTRAEKAEAQLEELKLNVGSTHVVGPRYEEGYADGRARGEAEIATLCDQYGLPHSVVALHTHLVNNHAAVYGLNKLTIELLQGRLDEVQKVVDEWEAERAALQARCGELEAERDVLRGPWRDSLVAWNRYNEGFGYRGDLWRPVMDAFRTAFDTGRAERDAIQATAGPALYLIRNSKTGEWFMGSIGGDDGIWAKNIAMSVVYSSQTGPLSGLPENGEWVEFRAGGGSTKDGGGDE